MTSPSEIADRLAAVSGARAFPSIGPCASPSVASINDRPEIGRAPASSGSDRVALPGEVVITLGYRDRSTAAARGRRTPEVHRAPVVLAGVSSRAEVMVVLGLAYSVRSDSPGFAISAASGQQDAGMGFRAFLADPPVVRRAISFIETLPTGYPTNENGFSPAPVRRRRPTRLRCGRVGAVATDESVVAVPETASRSVNAQQTSRRS